MNSDWQDIERLALHDPVLHAAVTRVQQGVSREDALIVAALVLAAEVAALRAEMLARYSGTDVRRDRAPAATPVPESREFGGPIAVGDHFILEKDIPSAWAHVIVTKIDTADSHGDPFDERRIWTRVVHGTANRTGSEAWNEEGRFREAVTPCDDRGVERPV